MIFYMSYWITGYADGASMYICSGQTQWPSYGYWLVPGTYTAD